MPSDEHIVLVNQTVPGPVPAAIQESSHAYAQSTLV